MNPILAANDTWKCPGHGSIVEDGRGRYFLLYHAYSTGGSIFTGREGMLDEVRFGADGWPTIDNNNGPSVQAPSPFGAPQQKTDIGYADNFAGNELSKGWQWPQDREPVCRLKNGQLWLSAKGRATNFLAAVLARSTTAADYVATAVIDMTSLKPGCAVGLCAFGDEQNAMGVFVRDGQIITWGRHRGEHHELSQQAAPPGQKLSLRLTARLGYRFQVGASAGDDRWISCGNATEAKDLPPWDRSVRVALTAGGVVGAEGVFDAFSLQPLAMSSEK